MPFQPKICNCSLSEYRHVVKSQADWERHQNKARSDRLASELSTANETLQLSLAPGLQRAQKRAPSPEDIDDEPPLIRKPKRQLCDAPEDETLQLSLAPGLQRAQKRAPSPEDIDDEPPLIRKPKRQLRQLHDAPVDETLQLSLTPGLQRAQKRAPSPEDIDDEPPLIRKPKRQLCDAPVDETLQLSLAPGLQRVQKPAPSSEDTDDDPLLIPEPKQQLCDVPVDLSAARSILLRAHVDSDYMDFEIAPQPIVHANEEPSALAIEADANRLEVVHDEPAFLPPGYQLEDDSALYDSDAEYDDTLDYSDDEMFDLMVGNMRRGYEAENEEEEDEELKDEDEDEDEEDEHSTMDPYKGQDLSNDGGLQNLYGTSADQNPLFDYREPVGDPLTAKETLSLAMHGIHRKFKTQRRCVDQIGDVMGRLLGSQNKPHDERTVVKRIEHRTGVKEIKYDCCPRSCMSYSMYPDDTECRVCHHPRWKTIINLRSKKVTERRVPYAQHIYIPLTHRIRLWWSNPACAKKMIDYRNTTMQGASTEGKSADFWTGQLLQDLKKQDQDRGANMPMFTQDTDIAFFFSTDGVKVFKSRRAFHIWPLLLINLNLPPAERVKRCNMILVGFVPGPKEPNDLDSFLFPLVQEMKMLEKGFSDGFNAARRNTAEETFLLRAYIVCVGADMIGRAKVGTSTAFKLNLLTEI
jgi:hypothetical protein